MTDHYQFHCPLCSILLTLPVRSAGTKGLCPACARAIIAPVPEPFQRRIADPFQPFPENRGGARPPASPPPPPFAEAEPFQSPPPASGFAEILAESDHGPSEEDLPYFTDPIPHGDPRAYFRNGPPPEPEIPEPAPPPPAAEPRPEIQPPPAPAPPPPVVMRPAVLIAPPPAASPPPQPEPAPPRQEKISPFAEFAAPQTEALDPGGAFKRQLPPVRNPESNSPAQAAREPRPHPPEKPFAGFRPQERIQPDPSPPARESSRKVLTRLRSAVLILSCLLCLVLGFICGHIHSLRDQSVPAPIFSIDPTPAPPLQVVDPDTRPALTGPVPPPELAGPDTPAPTPEPPPEIETPPTPPKPASLTTLEAFLSAPTWSARAVHVIDPEESGPSLRERGDGVIKPLSIRPDVMDDDFHHYVVSTEKIPEGFPVTLIRREDGWRVDWTTFDEFAHDRLRAFAAAGTGEADFHVFLKPVETANEHYLRCQISAPKPMEERSFPAFARLDGKAAAKIRLLLEDENIKKDADYQRLLADQGLPVVIKLTRSSNSQGQPFLVIQDLIRFGWAPEN